MKILLTLLFAANSFAAVTVGKMAPDFELINENGKKVSLKQFKGKHVVLEWFNKDCPFVVKHYESKNMQKLQKKYTGKNVVWLSIVSSAPKKQGHITSAEAMTLKTRGQNNATHILLDPTGEVGKKYGAKTTPHMYIVKPDGKLAYQGAIDSIPSTNQDDIKKAKNFVASNLDNLIAGKSVIVAKTPPYGCSVKY